MACEPFEMDGPEGKIRGFVCSRGRTPSKRCACGKPSTVLCDFPDRSVPAIRLGRRKTKPTCSAPLCAGCTTHVGPDRDLCGRHMQMARAAGAALGLLADPNQDALEILADLCEQRGLLPAAPAAQSRADKTPRGGRGLRASAPAAALAAGAGQRDLFDRPAPARTGAAPAPATCVLGDGAAAIREIDRLSAAASPKDETADFAGVWTRRRTDCLDVDAIDYVLAQDETFRPRSLEEWAEYVAERAAIFEFLAGRPRAAAEVMARQLAGPAPAAKRRPAAGGARA